MPARLLLVEDEPMIGRILVSKLEREGHAVEWVRDGEAALAALSRARPDLLLLDTSLPEPDGFEVLRRLRSEPETAALPVVMLTEYGKLEEAPRARSLGASECVEKPFKPTFVAKVVKTLLARAPAPPASG